MTTRPNIAKCLDRAAEAIADAQVLVITAGAGLGVDSGIPDYRSSGGFWDRYGPLKKLGFDDPKKLGNWKLLKDRPRLLLGIWALKSALFRELAPHEGYSVLLRMAKTRNHSLFTSNVDLAFEQTGFETWRVAKCHGSVDRFQCSQPCSDHTWEAPVLETDLESFEVVGPLPGCPKCGAWARPNVCFFEDSAFVAAPFWASQLRHVEWLNAVANRGETVVCIECGAGTGLPVVRMHSHGVVRKTGARLVRINVADIDGPPGTIPVAMGARDALLAIEELL